jgi:hypothetical protein
MRSHVAAIAGSLTPPLRKPFACKAQRGSHQRKQYGGLPRVVPMAEPTPAPSVAFEHHFIAARLEIGRAHV